MRRRAAARVLVLCTLTALWASTAGAVPAGAQQPTAQAVPGMRYLSDIWCGRDGSCLAVGITHQVTGGVVVLRADGSSGPVRPVPGTDRLSGIDCPARGPCIAVGRGGVVVEVSRDGTPGASRAAPGTSELNDVACPTTTTCLATGSLHTWPPDSAHGVTTNVFTIITNGEPQPAHNFPRGTRNASGIDCPTTTGCLVLAADGVVVLSDVDGTWRGTLRRVSSSSDAGYPAQGISCSSSTGCYATASGSVQTPEGYYGIPGIVPVSTEGVTGPVQVLTNEQGISNAISCVSGRNCTVVGQEHRTSRGLSIDVFRGMPSTPVVWENVNLFTGVSCIAPGTCGMVGYMPTYAVFAWHGPVPD